MKITLETVYKNVTEEWLDWWLDEHMSKALPANVIKEIKEQGFSTMTSRNSSSGVIVETTYKVD